MSTKILRSKGESEQKTKRHTLDIREVALFSHSELFQKLTTSSSGLTSEDAHQRIKEFGPNEIASKKKQPWFFRLLGNIKDPLSLLLLCLAVIAYFTKDYKTTVIIIVMLCLSIGLRFIQELKADKAAEKLQAMVRTTSTVIRDKETREVPISALVPGDLVVLRAGDLVPADVRVIESRDLFVNQATLTGESMPVEKHADLWTGHPENELDFTNICFMGTNIQSGFAKVHVVNSGSATKFGEMTVSLEKQQEISSFDRGVGSITWLMIRFIAIMVPLVFLINGVSKGNWVDAFIFALAVAVGLTPELLPMIITVNLSSGALSMSKRKVIVKRLNAIQNFGAMDILCTDKTGTLTKGKVSLIRALDVRNKENSEVLDLAHLNSAYQTNYKNLLDDAILERGVKNAKRLLAEHEKIDEIPYDFKRRRMSVVVSAPDGNHLMICKGAVEEMLQISKSVSIGKKLVSLNSKHMTSIKRLVDDLSSQGFRLLALATRTMASDSRVYSAADEVNLVLVGFLAFLDPPKETSSLAIQELERSGVQVKILTGDNELVTRKICGDVGLTVSGILLGKDIEGISDKELEQRVEEVNVYNRLEPEQKMRVVKALKRRGHVVGYMGDGINDALSLKAADVGISVDEAVDIAKESSDIILLKRSLLVLHEGVMEGRRVFGNITKYIKMAASSNFGNMLSVLGASIFLPFLPMLPLQIIINNLLYDFSQTTIPTDRVDREYLRKPRPWNINHIKRFILWMGPVSSLFDYLMFGVLIVVFHALSNPTLFQTGWFIESLVSQTLIIHIIRTRKQPFIQSRASRAIVWSTIIVTAIGALLPFSPLAKSLGFTPLPVLYWVLLLIIMIGYVAVAQVVKNIFVRRYGWE